MRSVAIAAALLSFAFVGHAAAQAPLVVNVNPAAAPVGSPIPPGVLRHSHIVCCGVGGSARVRLDRLSGERSARWKGCGWGGLATAAWKKGGLPSGATGVVGRPGRARAPAGREPRRGDASDAAVA